MSVKGLENAFFYNSACSPTWSAGAINDVSATEPITHSPRIMYRVVQKKWPMFENVFSVFSAARQCGLQSADAQPGDSAKFNSLN